MDPTQKHAFVKGVPRLADLGYIACANRDATEDRIEHTVFIDWDAGQFAEIATVPWLTAGVCVARAPLEQLIAVGEYGDVLVFGSGDTHNEKIGLDSAGPRSLGPLRSARAIDGLAYAAGMKRQVYRRDRAGVWNKITGIPQPEPGEVVGFESIDGFGSDELYAVGWKGELWYSESDRWRSVQSPTNLILTDVCCADDGNTYACGQQGVLLRGRYGKWSTIDTGSHQIDFWGLTYFAGALYVAGSSILLRLDGDSLAVVDTGPDRATSFGHLRHIADVMWSTGSDDLMAFDGSTWNRLG